MPYFNLALLKNRIAIPYAPLSPLEIILLTVGLMCNVSDKFAQCLVEANCFNVTLISDRLTAEYCADDTCEVTCTSM